MFMMVLDMEVIHANNPDCPRRWIAVCPDGKQYFCVDCGFQLTWKRVEVEEKPCVDSKNKEGE